MIKNIAVLFAETHSRSTKNSRRSIYCMDIWRYPGINTQNLPTGVCQM